MKVSKAGVWVCLVLAAIFAVIGVVLFVVKPASGPIVVSKDLEAWTTTSGYLVIDGKLKNDSDEELTITYIEIEVTTDGPTQVIYLDYYNLDEDEDPADYVLAPGEEFNLSGYGVGCSYDAHSLTICKVTVNGTEYTVYENMSAMTVFGVAMFIFAIVFIACALSTLVKAKKSRRSTTTLPTRLCTPRATAYLSAARMHRKVKRAKRRQNRGFGCRRRAFRSVPRRRLL